MDRRERIDDQTELLKEVIETVKREMWGALPCLVESVDMKKMILVAQPTIQCQVADHKGHKKYQDLPLLPHVPFFYTQGGDFIHTHPIRKGDECLVVFASRSIDLWWLHGGIQQQVENRLHDLSDGFALVGFRSQPRVLEPPPHPEYSQWRHIDGTCHITMKPDKTIAMVNEKGTIKLRPNGQFIIDSDCEDESIIRARKIHYYTDDAVSDPFNAIPHEGL